MIKLLVELPLIGKFTIMTERGRGSYPPVPLLAYSKGNAGDNSPLVLLLNGFIRPATVA
jgi:hypothetical protein